MAKLGQIGLADYWRLFIILDSSLLAVVYAFDGLSNPAYVRQGQIAPLIVYAAILLITSLAAFVAPYLARPKMGIGYALCWDYVGAIYLLFALSFWTYGLTAFVTYLLISIFSFLHAVTIPKH